MTAVVAGAWLNTGGGGAAGPTTSCIRTGAPQAARRGEVSRQRERVAKARRKTACAGSPGQPCVAQPQGKTRGVGAEKAEARRPRASQTPRSTGRGGPPMTDRLVLPDHRGGCVGVSPKVPLPAGGSPLPGSDHRETGSVGEPPPGPPAAPAGAPPEPKP